MSALTETGTLEDKTRGLPVNGTVGSAGYIGTDARTEDLLLADSRTCWGGEHL